MPSKAQRESMNSPLAMDLTKGICYRLLFDGVDTDNNVKRDIEKKQSESPSRRRTAALNLTTLAAA